MTSAFMLVQVLYWLALATWFGGVLFITVAAPIIFRTVVENDPTLPMVLSVNLEGRHSTLLSGSIVANLMTAIMRIHLVCAGVLGLAVIGQWIILFQLQLGLLIVRTAMFIPAVILLLYDWRVVMPQVFKHRQEYIDHADEPDVANAAKDQFDKYHRESITVLMFELFVLLGLVLFSVGISAAQTFTFGGH